MTKRNHGDLPFEIRLLEPNEEVISTGISELSNRGYRVQSCEPVEIDGKTHFMVMGLKPELIQPDQLQRAAQQIQVMQAQIQEVSKLAQAFQQEVRKRYGDNAHDDIVEALTGERPEGTQITVPSVGDSSTLKLTDKED